MNIYFSAAVTQRATHKQAYQIIKDTIVQSGHTYLEAYDVLHTNLSKILDTDISSHTDYFATWDKIVKKADIAIIETSFPSTIHIGLEIAHLVDLGKPTICLYKSGSAPMFLHKFLSNRLIISEYNESSLKETVLWSIDQATQWISRRFTFFLPPHLDAHLDTIQKTTHVTKSEYIRMLLEKDASI